MPTSNPAGRPTLRARPSSPRLNDVDGVVKRRLVLGKDGKVSHISVVKGLPDGLTERAIETAEKLKLKPAEAGADPRASRGRLSTSSV